MPNTVVKMPQLGESVSEGTIGRWLKKPGDRVERDEPLVEIQTDKVNAEVPSPVAGILQRILLPEGTTASVKTDMAIIGDEAPSGDQAPPATEAPAAQGPEGTTKQRTPAESAAASPPPLTFTYDKSSGGGVVGHREEEPAAATDGAGAKRFYTPVVLRMAEEHGIDLSRIRGSGAHGRVTRRDVERAIEQAPSPSGTGQGVRGAYEPQADMQPSPAASRRPLFEGDAIGAAQLPAQGEAVREVALTPMRRAIAEHMARARAEIPDAWSVIEIDVTRLVRYRQSLQAEWQAREGYELTYLPFFVKAVLSGLRAVPELNASWAGDHVVVRGQYNLGIAVSVENGLVVPVLREVDQLSVAGVARALRPLIQRARSGRLTMDDLQGATFTVNNPGSLGSIMSQPIVPVGQAGIVTMEAVVKRPVVTADDAIAIRSMMNSCLSFDHRVLDGAGALKFLRTLKHELEAVEYPLY
jgi:2-oxoisovalerate dehydrogenase E2 component (dihydrolipoyl transacylase)